MEQIDRRRFLQLAGGATAAAAMSGGFADSIARAASIPAHRSRGTIEDVEHIVVLMQENRSFDHYFGTHAGVRGFGDPRPVTLPSGKSVWHQPTDGSARSAAVPPGRRRPRHAVPRGPRRTTGPTATRRCNSGKYDQWVPAKGTATMAYLTREDIPFHYALADAFTVCDAYHCSFIGSTDPNRYYMWTGYTGNDGKGGGPVLGNDELGYDWTTYPERLEQAGVSWKIYQDIGDGLDADRLLGLDRRTPTAATTATTRCCTSTQYRNAKPGDPLYDKARTGTERQGRATATSTSSRPTSKAGKLPQVSWIAAPEAFTEHPNWPAELRRLVHLPGPGRAHLQPGGVEQDRAVHHLRRERRLLRPRRPAVPAARRRSRATSTVDDRARLLPGRRRELARRPVRPRASACRCSSSRRGAPAATSAPRRSTTPRSSGSWSAGSACEEPNISPWRRAVCGDLTSAFDFARRDTDPRRRCRTPTATSRRTASGTPTTCPSPPADRVAARSRSRACGRRAPLGYDLAVRRDAGRRRDRRRLRQPRLAGRLLPRSPAGARRCAAQLHGRRR